TGFLFGKQLKFVDIFFLGYEYNGHFLLQLLAFLNVSLILRYYAKYQVSVLHFESLHVQLMDNNFLVVALLNNHKTYPPLVLHQLFLTSTCQKPLHLRTLNQLVTLHDFFLGRNVEFLVLYKNNLYESRILIYINYVSQFHFVLVKHCEMAVNVGNYLLFPYDYLIADDSLFLVPIIFLPISKTFPQ